MICETLIKCYNILSVWIIILLLTHKENVLKLKIWNSVDQEVKLNQFMGENIEFEYSFEWIYWEIWEKIRNIFCYTKYMCVRLV
jgi:hypothetical protein